MSIETVSVAAKRGGGVSPARLRELIGEELAHHGPREVARDALVLIAETTLRTDPRLDPEHVAGEVGLRAAIREAVEEVRAGHPTLFESGVPQPYRSASPPVVEGAAVELDRDRPQPASDPVSRAKPKGAAPAAIPVSGAQILRKPEPYDGPVPPRGPDLERSPKVRPSHLVYGGLAATLLLGAVLTVGSDQEESTAARSVGRIPEDRAAPLPPPKPERAAARNAPIADPETTGSIPGGEEKVVFPKEHEVLKGVPDVVDTATLKIDGRTIKLFGVEPAKGSRGADLSRYLKRRAVDCDPTATADVYRCTVDNYDLSEVVLYNGGARASADASPDLKAAEAHAREEGFGIWKKR